MALKRKKRYEKQLQQIDGTMSTIEFQREALQNATTNTEVLRVMGDAAKAMKSAHKNMNVDDVHNLMDDVAEQQEIANEISEAISNPVGFQQDVDEDDLLAELEELEQQDLEEKLLDVGPSVDQLPAVPAAQPASREKPKAVSKADEDEMKELEMWAS
jgi:charged multivesicular body protein 4